MLRVSWNLTHFGGRMNKFKLIVTDLDYTLLRDDKSVSSYTLEVFRKCKEKNLLTAIATGRMVPSAREYIDMLKPDFEITNDGALTVRRGEIIHVNELPKELIERLLRTILANDKETDIFVSTTDETFWNQKFNALNPPFSDFKHNDYLAPWDRNAIKIVSRILDEKLAEELGQSQEYKLLPYRGESRYAILNKIASKGKAIRNISEMYGIELNEIIAFGDDYNDVEMLQECGTGVAVANSIEDVLKVADYVTKSNEEDGVADFIERYALT